MSADHDDRGDGMAGLAGAVGFLTVLGGAASPTAGALRWFPVVGAGIGAVVGAAWWGAAELWPPLVAAVVVVSVDVALTGALHHDGLADSADGLLPHMDRARRLEVMRQPDVGTFAVMVLVTTSLARVGAIASVEPRPALVAGLWCASRTGMAVIARTVPYARPAGLASGFLGGSALPVTALGALLAVALAVVADGLVGLAALAAVVLVAGGVTVLARRRVGGFTGDVLGAAGLLGETGGLLVMAARW